MNITFVGLSSISPNVGLQLWLSYLEYICRNNSDPIKIDKLFSQAVEQFGVENDSSSKVSRWYARLLAKRGDMFSARKIWNGILGHQANKGEKVVVTMLLLPLSLFVTIYCKTIFQLQLFFGQSIRISSDNTENPINLEHSSKGPYLRIPIGLSVSPRNG